MVAPEPAKKTLPVEEIKESLSLLSDADMSRLLKIAKYYSRQHRIDPDDLLQGAFEAALDGRRNCPCDIKMVCFLAGTMKSLASSRFKSLSNSPESNVLFFEDDYYELPAVNCPSEAPNADSILISEQEAATINAAIKSLFADDEIAWIIVEGDMEGIEASELQELTGLDKISYASKRRLIRRRINKAYPEGWKP